MTTMGGKPLSAWAEPWANHLMNPTLFRPSARATRVASSTSVLQAARCPATSSQLTILARSMTEIAMRAVVVASISSPPNTHRRTVRRASAPMRHSLRVTGPIAASSLAAHRGTSGPPFTSGGYTLYTSQGRTAMSTRPMGRNPRSHSAIVIGWPIAFSTMPTASRLGASAVTNIELVTAVAAKATHMT